MNGVDKDGCLYRWILERGCLWQEVHRNDYEEGTSGIGGGGEESRIGECGSLICGSERRG